MIDQIVALVVDESKWLTVSMGFALLAVTILLCRYRRSGIAARRRISAAMNLFFGVVIGMMALGHLLAVTTKLVLGTLEGSVLRFYLIGAVLVVPSWLLVWHTRAVLASDNEHGLKTLILNTWLAITLLALGVYNLPLAAPALFNIGYQLHSRRLVGWVIVSLAVVLNVGLFIGSLIFFASGQSFEEFRGLPE